MIKVYNDIIPFDGYIMTIVPFIFINTKKEKFDAEAERHENTHALQQIEMLLLGALISFILFLFGCGWYSLITLGLYFEWYCLECAIKYLFTRRAYKSISFEQEAYDHEDEVYYNEVRKHFAWIRYIFKLK